jgi:hypothetical protein
MIYDLKKTKTTDAETFKHFLTVLSIFFKEHEEALDGSDYNKALICMQGAEEYARRYIEELINQTKK